jgi:hypothetical protein
MAAEGGEDRALTITMTIYCWHVAPKTGHLSHASSAQQWVVATNTLYSMATPLLAYPSLMPEDKSVWGKGPRILHEICTTKPLPDSKWVTVLYSQLCAT